VPLKDLQMSRITGPFLALAIATVSAGCGPRVGDEPIGGGAGALGGFERAERSCTARAEARGLVVEGVQFTQSSQSRGGRIAGAETVLIVSRDGASYPLRCRFIYRTGEARLSSA
jgi:hypothetical protein